MTKNYNDFMMRLLRDKQLRRFAFETIQEEELLGMIKPPITAKLIKNEKGRYRMLVSDGKRTFDVRKPDKDKLELMRKIFNQKI